MSDRQREQLNEKKHTVRRKWLKVLAFFERRRVGFLRGWDKVSGAVARHPVSPLLYVAVLALVVGVFSFNKMYAHAYVLSVDGVEMGVLSADENVDAIVANVEPVLNPTWCFLLLGENPGALSLSGAAVVLLAVTAYSLLSKKEA